MGTNDGGKEVYLSDKQFEDAVELIKSSIALSIHMTNPQRQDDDEFQHVTSVDDNPPSAATSRTSLQSQSIALQSISNQGRPPRLSNRNEPVTRQRSTSRRPPRSTTGARESKQSLTSRSSLSIQGIKERLSRIGINRQQSHKQPSMERTPSINEKRSVSRVNDSKMSLVDRGKLSIARLESKLSISHPKYSVSKVSTNSRANDL